MVAYVRSTPGAIGYVSAGADVRGVRVVTVVVRVVGVVGQVAVGVLGLLGAVVALSASGDDDLLDPAAESVADLPTVTVQDPGFLLRSRPAKARKAADPSRSERVSQRACAGKHRVLVQPRHG